MSTNVWAVRGQTGEYDDTTSWGVRVFVDKELAEHHCVAANNAAKDTGYHQSLGDTSHDSEDFKRWLNVDWDLYRNDLDLQHAGRVRYPGVNYFVEEIPFEG